MSSIGIRPIRFPVANPPAGGPRPPRGPQGPRGPVLVDPPVHAPGKPGHPRGPILVHPPVVRGPQPPATPVRFNPLG